MIENYPKPRGDLKLIRVDSYAVDKYLELYEATARRLVEQGRLDAMPPTPSRQQAVDMCMATGCQSLTPGWMLVHEHLLARWFATRGAEIAEKIAEMSGADGYQTFINCLVDDSEAVKTYSGFDGANAPATGSVN